MRFLARFFVLPGDKEDKALKKMLWLMAEELVVGDDPRKFESGFDGAGSHGL